MPAGRAEVPAPGQTGRPPHRGRASVLPVVHDGRAVSHQETHHALCIPTHPGVRIIKQHWSTGCFLFHQRPVGGDARPGYGRPDRRRTTPGATADAADALRADQANDQHHHHRSAGRGWSRSRLRRASPRVCFCVARIAATTTCERPAAAGLIRRLPFRFPGFLWSWRRGARQSWLRTSWSGPECARGGPRRRPR